MGKCVAQMDDPNDHKRSCGRDTPSGYRYCEEHQDRAKAKKESAEQAATVISLPQTERNINSELRRGRAQELTASELIAKVVDMVDHVVQFEDIAWKKVESLDGEWRRVAKDGSEQVRGEVQVYERALDRSGRILGQITKLGIDAQLASASQNQLEAVKVAVMKALLRLGLSGEQLREARTVLAEEFAKISEAS